MSLYVDIRKKLGGFTLETQFEAADGVTASWAPPAVARV